MDQRLPGAVTLKATISTLSLPELSELSARHKEEEESGEERGRRGHGRMDGVRWRPEQGNEEMKLPQTTGEGRRGEGGGALLSAVCQRGACTLRKLKSGVHVAASHANASAVKTSPKVPHPSHLLF